MMEQQKKTIGGFQRQGVGTGRAGDFSAVTVRGETGPWKSREIDQCIGKQFGVCHPPVYL